MGKLPFTDIQTRPLEVLDLTSLTLDEFRPASPPAAASTPAAPSPLGGMRGRHGASRAPRTRVSRRAVIVARKHAIL